MTAGIPYLPVHVTSQWLEPSESGNFKIIANHLEISNITEELLPRHFGLKYNELYVSEFDNAIPHFLLETCAGNHGSCMPSLEYVMHMKNT